jgi:orotate phosphoribosyltransferase
MNILHITDLHLHDFEGENEFLRKGFYKEYIDRLYSAIVQSTENIDYLIVSGDFIDKGNTENYKFIIIILEYLLTKFKIEKQNLCLTIGNHDYNWKDLSDDDVSKEIVLKEPFKNFRNHFNSYLLKDGDNFYLSKLEDNLYFLSVDSTWRSKGGSPGKFSIPEEDTLIAALNEYLDEKSTLLIGCHFPIISIDDNFLAMEEPDWHENHVWIQASSLRDRIKRIQTKQTLWFHGDVHASDQRIIENEIFVLTSKFGGPPDTSEHKRQAVIISIDDENITRRTCSYEFPTHKQQSNLGDWKCSSSRELRVLKPIETETLEIENTLIAYNDEVENEILRLIEQKELYKFGRFHVSDEYISLGWVEINKLMNDKKLLNRITDKCYELINKLISSHYEKTIFFGIEIIGGILASQLSVRFNVRNSIIPIRSKLGHYSEFEFLHSTAFNNMSSIDNVVVFIDLISSGDTINSLVDEILTANSNVNIHVISIISNNIEQRLLTIPKTKSYSTFCSRLRIPIIKHEEMPGEEFVNPNLKY